MEKLTQKQQAVLDFIKKYSLENGTMPTIREIAAKFKITIGPVQKYLEVLTKKGYLDKKDSRARGIEIKGRQKFAPVPILGSVHAGTFLEPVEDAQDYVYINTDVTRSRECFALKVKGDSMEPSGIVEGDTVVISKSNQVTNGDIVVAMIEGEAAIKQYNKSAGRVAFISTNPLYPPVYPKDYKVLGKLIYLVREYKN
ncbi:transcriptional repressor LexA [Endomicrobium proavitum]|uniref:DNA-binding transcriptional repressor of SOS regulon n=1 Tax=Endomicrobium proavitum TaxID=1408281 RepID=A0A0G3WJ45_9BACT|nr:transcriptional repressor LexA [Endomicrobium proavitum]AKL97907.1 DNA-binding transcriptional repressor of SOS regulon [Endomicrobium proavitum]